MPDQKISADTLKTDPGSATYVAAVDTGANVRLDQAGVRGWVDKATVVPNVQTGSYTLVMADVISGVEMNVASANNCTVPPNATVAFPIGAVVEVTQVGAGTTTIVAGAGVTIRQAAGSTLALRAQWASASIRKRATNEWVAAGDFV
jgi:hypothetical protein